MARCQWPVPPLSCFSRSPVARWPGPGPGSGSGFGGPVARSRSRSRFCSWSGFGGPAARSRSRFWSCSWSGFGGPVPGPGPGPGICTPLAMSCLAGPAPVPVHVCLLVWFWCGRVPVPVKRITYAVCFNVSRHGCAISSRNMAVLQTTDEYCEVGTIIRQKQEPNGCQSQLLDMKTLDVTSLAAVFLKRLCSRCWCVLPRTVLKSSK